MSESHNMIEDSVDSMTNPNNASSLYNGMPNNDLGNHTAQTTNDVTNMTSTNSQFNPNVLPSDNYPENKGCKNKDFFASHGMTSQINIDALERFKNYEIYYLPTIMRELKNKQKYKDILLKNPRNYIPKAFCVFNNSNSFNPYILQQHLYYGLKIDNTMYCAYVDGAYRLHKKHFYIPPNNRNSNGY